MARASRLSSKNEAFFAKKAQSLAHIKKKFYLCARFVGSALGKLLFRESARYYTLRSNSP